MKKKQTITPPKVDRPYLPQAHPMQHRLDAFRVIPSLVTSNPEQAPKGK